MTDAIESLVYSIEHSSTAKFVQMMTPGWPFQVSDTKPYDPLVIDQERDLCAYILTYVSFCLWVIIL